MWISNHSSVRNRGREKESVHHSSSVWLHFTSNGLMVTLCGTLSMSPGSKYKLFIHKYVTQQHSSNVFGYSGCVPYLFSVSFVIFCFQILQCCNLCFDLKMLEHFRMKYGCWQMPDQMLLALPNVSRSDEVSWAHGRVEVFWKYVRKILTRLLVSYMMSL